MKKLIYLPLIVAIILAGCKSSSFMKQRYTNYGHASHKSGAAIAKEHKRTAALAPVPETAPTAQSRELTASANTSPVKTASTRQLPAVYHSIVKSVRKNLNIPDNSSSVAKADGDSKTLNKADKNSVQKSAKAKGPIGTVLKIVLFVVILAVVVSLIILVVLVS